MSDKEGEPGASDVPAGLAPSEAREWLAFQRRFAWVPEIVGPLLESGTRPEALLSAASSARGATLGLGFGDKTAPSLAGSEAERKAALDREVARLEGLGVRVLPRFRPDYPAGLTALPDAPGVLFFRGEARGLQAPCVAIVGARAATRAAIQTAHQIARDLAARGVTVVSGLARGIDRAAHEGAIQAGGRTVAVLASGIEEIYPPEHRGLAAEIVRTGGAILTEMPMGSKPRRAHFPLRNRLISGLSAAVVVVEARQRSGSLITVRHALNQGRDVFVVPGAVEGPFAMGTNQLLRDGARPVLCAGDILEDLGWAESRGLLGARGAIAEGAGAGGSADPRLESTDPGQRAVLSVLATGPVAREDLAGRLALDPGELAEALLELELADRVVEDRDGQLQLNWQQEPARRPA